MEMKGPVIKYKNLSKLNVLIPIEMLLTFFQCFTLFRLFVHQKMLDNVFNEYINRS